MCINRLIIILRDNIATSRWRVKTGTSLPSLRRIMKSAAKQNDALEALAYKASNTMPVLVVSMERAVKDIVSASSIHRSHNCFLVWRFDVPCTSPPHVSWRAVLLVWSSSDSICWLPILSFVLNSDFCWLPILPCLTSTFCRICLECVCACSPGSLRTSKILSAGNSVILRYR
jgi:hypothetical protein